MVSSVSKLFKIKYVLHGGSFFLAHPVDLTLPKNTRAVSMLGEIVFPVREDSPKIPPQILSKELKNVKI